MGTNHHGHSHGGHSGSHAGHSHGGHGGHTHGGHNSGSGAQNALLATLAVNGTLFFAELIGGLWTGSLALLSDAAHMFVDVGALLVSAAALWLASKKPTAEKTYGYHRAEVLAALLNGVALWVLMGALFFEAFGRLSSPHHIHAPGMISIAVLGLLANLVGLGLLHKHKDHNLNIKSSYLHVLADAMGSVVATLAGVAVYITGETRFDVVASFAIGIFTLYVSYGLIRGAIDILMESTPQGIVLADVRQAMLSVSGVTAVHDLHVWAIGSQRFALSAHANISASTAPTKAILAQLSKVLAERFNIGHTTIQLEEQSLNTEAACEGGGCD